MTQRVDLFDSTYQHFNDRVLDAAGPVTNDELAEHTLTSGRRLSRVAYLGENPAG